MIRKAITFGGIAFVAALVIATIAWAFAPAAPTAAAGPDLQLLQPGADLPDPHGRREHGARAPLERLISIAADTIGISATEVRTGLENGQSLTDIAAANGSGGDAIVQAAVDAAQQRLDQAVQNGRLSQNEADRMLDRLTETVTRLVDDPELGQRAGERREQARETALIMGLVRATADLSNLAIPEVLDAVRAGQSLAAIATANGSTADAVVQQLVDRQQPRLDRAVAAGRLTQEEADELLAAGIDRATELVNDPNLADQLAERRAQIRERGVQVVMVNAVADATGLPPHEIAQRIRAGESLTDIATAAGADPASIVNSAVDAFRSDAEQVMNQ